MRAVQIESWALRIIDQVNNNQPNEDFLVELKRDWIEPKKAARRIAGHANAARGENILWLVGVDEKEGVLGASDKELANWYPSVKTYFDEFAPRMTSVNVVSKGLTVVALLFETERLPFVVKNPKYGSSAGGAVELEVPWREDTTTRSARRSDLVRLLFPISRMPEVEVLSIKLSEQIEGRDEDTGNYLSGVFNISAEMYIAPSDDKRLVIPFHRCGVEFDTPGNPSLKAHWLEFCPSHGRSDPIFSRRTVPGSLTIESTTSEVIVNGPGKMSLSAVAKKPSAQLQEITVARVLISLLPIGFDSPIKIEEDAILC